MQGSRPDILRSMRKIELSPTITDHGELTNGPFRVYDTSVKYTKARYKVDIKKSLPEIKRNWIYECNDFEENEG